MEWLTSRGHNVDLQVMDIEARAAYKQVVEGTWKAKYQLVPPDIHRCNSDERDIRTFKANFLAILARVDPNFPSNMWDKLLPQTNLTLNLLRQETLNPRISEWKYLNGLLDFGATPLFPVGSRVTFHNKPGNRKSWFSYRR